MSEQPTLMRSRGRGVAALIAFTLSLFTVVTFAGTAQAAPSCARIVFTTGAQTVSAGAVSSAITVEARKNGASNCSLPGSPAVTLSVVPSSGGFFSDAAGTASITSVTLASTAPHRATFYYMDTVTGSRQITATNAALGSVSQTETVIPATLDHFSLVAPGTSAPGSAFSITVTAQDPFDNTVTGYLGAVHFSTSDAQGAVPSDYAFTSADAGGHTFPDGVTLSTTGSQSIQVADGGIVGTATVSVRIDHPVSGTASGTASLVIIPGSKTCTSPATQDSDHLCQYNLRGTYADEAYLGSGKIGGRVVLDDRSYGPNATYGLNCYSNIVGVVKFINSQGTLRTKTDKSQSVVCDESSGGAKDSHLRLLGLPGGNVGVYTNVVGGTITWDGTWTPTSATTFHHSDTFEGVVQTT